MRAGEGDLHAPEYCLAVRLAESEKLLLVGEEHMEQAATLAGRVDALLAGCPARLLENLQEIYAPSQRPPGQSDSLLAYSQPGQGRVVLLPAGGRAAHGLRAPNKAGEPPAGAMLLYHELAHLSSPEGGPPDSLRLAWKEARLADWHMKGPHLRVRARLFPHLVEDGPMRRKLSCSRWVSAYAEANQESEREDWSDALALLGLDRLHGGARLPAPFQELYPYRNALIECWLAGRA